MNRFQRACCAGGEDARSRSVMREHAMATGHIDPCLNNLPLAMAYVPSQRFEDLYEVSEAWRNGTLFAALNKPYEGGGRR